MSKTTYRCPNCGGHNLRIKATMYVDLAVFVNEAGEQYLDFEEQNMAGFPKVDEYTQAVCGGCLTVRPFSEFTVIEGAPQ